MADPVVKDPFWKGSFTRKLSTMTSTEDLALVREECSSLRRATRNEIFSGIRECHGKASKIVAGMADNGDPTASCTHSARGGATVSRQLSEIQDTVMKNSKSQEIIMEKQEQMEKKIQEMTLNRSLSKSVDYLNHDFSNLGLEPDYDCVYTPRKNSSNMSYSGFHRSRTTSDFSDKSSGAFGNYNVTESQIGRLEECLSQEMLNNVTRRVKRCEQQGTHLSAVVTKLQTDVQELWRHNSGRHQDQLFGSPDPEPHPLPPHIRAFCLKIQDVVHQVRVLDLARYLKVDESKISKRSNSRTVFWEIIQHWHDECGKQSKTSLLEEVIDACKNCGIHNPLKVQPMPMLDRLVLEQNYSFLSETLMVPLVINYLRDSGMLTPDLVAYVLEPGPRPEKVTRLIDIMTVFGNHALAIFKEALVRSAQGHIAERLVCKDGAHNTDERVSVHPSECARLRESLQHQLKDLNTDIVRIQKDICQVSTGQISEGVFHNMEVAVKIPNNMSTLTVLQEAKQMKCLKHDHILKLIAVNMFIDPPWIITEPVKGNLLDHVRRLQTEEFSNAILCQMSRQVCKGMMYLETELCIHGDLRAENIMLGENGIPKIANFYPRAPDDDTAPRIDPSRWSAPEVIQAGRVSIKSDVWAFGVVLWELFTKGCVPYPDIKELPDVTECILQGQVMSPRHNVPVHMYALMTNCWKYFPTDRPNFLEIHKGLRVHERKPSSRKVPTPLERELRYRSSFRDYNTIRRRSSFRERRVPTFDSIDTTETTGMRHANRRERVTGSSDSWLKKTKRNILTKFRNLKKRR